jgi:hypothetical protein
MPPTTIASDTGPVSARQTGMPDTVAALAAAASLLSCAAALGAAVDTGHVSVTVGPTGISVQVNQHSADEATRTAIVAAHAGVLAAAVTRGRRHSPHTWIETRGVLAGHPVHVWTIADDADPAQVS